MKSFFSHKPQFAGDRIANLFSIIPQAHSCISGIICDLFITKKIFWCFCFGEGGFRKMLHAV